MLQAIMGFLGTIFGWLGNLLPDSPLREVATVTQDMALGISWLNWLVPISDMLVILFLWIAACVAITAVRVALDVTGDLAGKVVE